MSTQTRLVQTSATTTMFEGQCRRCLRAANEDHRWYYANNLLQTYKIVQEVRLISGNSFLKQ